MTAIDIRHLTVPGAAGEPPVLEDVSLSVPSGRSLAVLGPEGAGKSALVRAIVGLDEVVEGEIRLDDELVNAAPPRDRDMATLLQDFPLVPHLDAFDNMAFSAKLRRGVDRAALAEDITSTGEMLGLATVLDGLKPRDLTESERQRVAIGRVLVRDALAYVLDEPFAALELRVRGHVRSVVADRQRAGQRTTIYTTSDVMEALTIADRIAVLHQGILHQVGTAQDLYDRPANLFVAAYVGQPAMSLVPARRVGSTLELPFLGMPIPEGVASRTRDGDVLLVGIRPQDLHSADEGDVPTGHLTFTAKVDDVEWLGSVQHAFLGFDVDPATDALLTEIEDQLDFDLFQSYLLASVPPRRRLEPGMHVRVVVPTDRVLVFDPLTGANLTLPA